MNVNEKIKFYRETLVEMVKQTYKDYGISSIDDKIYKADQLTKAIIKQCDEYANENCINSVKGNIINTFGGDNCCDPKFWVSNNTNISGFVDLSSNSVKQMEDSTINGNHIKNDYPVLKYECHLTQEDIDYILELIHLIYNDISAYVITKNEEKIKCANERLDILGGYIRDSNFVRTRAQEKQLNKIMEENANQNSKEEESNQKSYGTLGEH